MFIHDTLSSPQDVVNVRPTQLGMLPRSARFSWTFVNPLRDGKTTLVWWSREVLQLYENLLSTTRGASFFFHCTLCGLPMDTRTQGVCTLPAIETLVKQFSDVFQAYTV
jgi:hypothetical protein